MEAKNIIYGTLALAVVGGGAYWFLKNKKVSDAKKLAILQLQSATAPTGSTSVPVTNASIGLPTAPVTNAQLQATQQDTSKQIQAQGLANQIAGLKSQYASLSSEVPVCIFNMNNIGEFQKCNVVRTQILDIQNTMNGLGYKEVNGSAVKL
jgi:hypothetical protein